MFPDELTSCPRCRAPHAPDARTCPRCKSPVPEGSSSANADGTTSRRPAAWTALLVTTDGQVTSRLHVGQHRPLAVVPAAVAAAVLTIGGLIFLVQGGAMSASLDSVVAGALAVAALVLSAVAAVLGPLLPLVLYLLLILIGIRLILVPVWGAPRRGRLPRSGRGLVGSVITITVRLVAAVLRAVLRGLRLLLTQAAARRPSVTFTVTDRHGNPWHVRLLQEAPGLGHGETVQARGLYFGGVLHARTVRVPATGVVLRSRSGPATPLAVVLVVLALTTAASPWLV